MYVISASNSAVAVGWICLIAGLGLLGAGVYFGFTATAAVTSGDAKKKLDEAGARLDETRKSIETTQEMLSGRMGVGGMESTGPVNPEAAKEIAGAAATQVTDAQSALEQVGSIVGSLPENLRFAGVLVLVGTVLISVATIQFGGTSLF